MPTYRVTIGSRRTTVSLDKKVSDFLGLHLGHLPDAHRARGAVRTWFQAEVDAQNDLKQIRVSQHLRSKAVPAVARADLANRFAQWQMDTILSEMKLS